MANVLALGNVVEAKLYCKSSGQYSINTLHFRVSAVAGTSTNDTNAATAVSGAFAAPMKALLSENAEFIGVTVQIIRSTRRPKVYTLADAAPGTVLGDSNPRQVAGLVTKLSATASKSGRGRFYVPFSGEADNEPGATPSGDYVTRLQTLGAQIVTPITAGAGGNTAVLTPVLYNRETFFTIDINDYTARTYWATCRRRGDARGGDRPPF